MRRREDKVVNKTGYKKERQRGKESEENSLKEICKKGFLAWAKNKKAALGRGSLLEQVSHVKRKMIRKWETSVGPRCVWYHACTGASLTTGNLLFTCEKTYRTCLSDSNLELRHFQLAVSTVARNWFWKPVSFDHKCGRRYQKNLSWAGRDLSFSSLSSLSQLTPLLAGKGRVRGDLDDWRMLKCWWVVF